MSVPIRFPGSTAERERNIASHFWIDDEDSGMCNDCGCKPYSVTATWPCGTDVPKTTGGAGNPPHLGGVIVRNAPCQSNEENQ